MSDWQPIETAPKQDGLRRVTVILFRPTREGGDVSTGYHDDDRYAKNPRPLWTSTARHHGRTGDRAHPPTHWQPLPAPPETGDPA